MNNTSFGRDHLSGFTLIELMVVVAIIAILGLLVYPSYQKDMYASRRSDAMAALNEDAQVLERCYTQYFSYNNASCPAVPTTSPKGYYSIASTITASTYTLTATPLAGGPQAGDSECTSFTLGNTGAQGATGSGGASAASECWTN